MTANHVYMHSPYAWFYISPNNLVILRQQITYEESKKGSARFINRRVSAFAGRI